MNKEKLKEHVRDYFKNFILPPGRVSKQDEMDIMYGYEVLFEGEEILPANMIRECDGDFDKYYRILLDCIKRGKPYRLPAEVRARIERMDRQGVYYDF